MMRMLPRTLFFPLILFICCCFCFSKAIDCGGKHIAHTIVVDKNGRAGGAYFRTIQSAIDFIKVNNTQWIKIQINAGTYIERVQIPLEKPCIILRGSGIKTTIVSYGDSAGLARSTFTSYPPNVVINGITFVNPFAFKVQGAAPAAAIYGDKTAISNCGFLGYQDTLYDASGRHYFRNCLIKGEIDFICGWAQSYYEDCIINATQFSGQPPGFITAQCRNNSNDPGGFVFRRGRVDGIGKVDLGRPWAAYSRVIFWETYLSSVVSPRGWDAWDFVGQENKLTYAEVNCMGLGAQNTSRVGWEKKPWEIDLKEYELSSFINRDNWLGNIPAF